MRIVDTRGQLCPAPLIAAKRALNETADGDSFEIVTDNQTSFDNLSRFLRDNKSDLAITEKEGVWNITVTKTNTEVIQTRAEEYCTSSISHFQKGNFVVVISSEKMGEGDDKLGALLMTNFIKALKDIDKLPQRIVFYNSGVKLVTVTSPVIEDLRDLEKMGVDLMLCSTCVNYYSLIEVIGAGTISNMYAIAEVLAVSGKIIKP